MLRRQTSGPSRASSGRGGRCRVRTTRGSIGGKTPGPPRGGFRLARAPEDGVADRLGLEPPQAGTARGGGSRGRRSAATSGRIAARLAIGGRGHDQTVDRLLAPSRGDELGGQPVEQLGVRGLFAHGAEVGGGRDQPGAEMPLPEPVDLHPRRERIARVGEPVGQGRPPSRARRPRRGPRGNRARDRRRHAGGRAGRPPPSSRRSPPQQVDRRGARARLGDPGALGRGAGRLASAASRRRARHSARAARSRTDRERSTSSGVTLIRRPSSACSSWVSDREVARLDRPRQVVGERGLLLAFEAFAGLALDLPDLGAERLQPLVELASSPRGASPSPPAVASGRSANLAGGEDRDQAVIVLGRDRVELVVVAAGAVDRQAEEDARRSC